MRKAEKIKSRRFNYIMTIENEKEIDEMSATEMLVRSIREYLKKCKSLDELDEFLANLLAKKEK